MLFHISVESILLVFAFYLWCRHENDVSNSWPDLALNNSYCLISLQVVLRSHQTTSIGTSIEAEPLASRWTWTVAPSVMGKCCWAPTWRSLSMWITAPQQSVHFLLLVWLCCYRSLSVPLYTRDLEIQLVFF